ncbi:MAG TPA: TIGR02217 family protein, partial [Allosphingosinicella sp.]
MGHWLAPRGAAKQVGFVKRFDPRLWTVNFPRPMMASVVTTGPGALRVDCVFYKADDLAGLIWEAEDRFDHNLLAYETSRDFRGCRLSFRWRSAGLRALDSVDGPTLTIEGRDPAGAPRSWFVRLWNYAEGTEEDALIALDFAALAGGWAAEDPVWAGDIDRMFVSMVAPGFTREDAPLAARAEGWAELSEIACVGAGSVLATGDVLVPEHRLRIATGYDDLYHLTPARVLRNMLQLGYRGPINHYVGMSHYFRLEANSGGYYISLAGGVLNVPCAAWHSDFAARAKALGFELIWSLSYELLDQHVWGDWKQRAQDGSPALTGWSPPSTLLSPAHEGAMYYLRLTAQAFAAIAAAAGLRMRFQIGEPWWWVAADGRICLYDSAAVARFAPV